MADKGKKSTVGKRDSAGPAKKTGRSPMRDKKTPQGRKPGRVSGDNVGRYSAERPRRDRPRLPENDAQEIQRDIITGKNALLARLEEGRGVNRIWLSDGLRRDAKLEKIMALASQQNVKYQFVKKFKLDGLAGSDNHQGVIAEIPPYSYVLFEDLLTDLKKRGGTHLVLVMDGIEDPHNAGAIIRTSVAAGASAVIMPKYRNVQMTQAVGRASAGTVEKIPVSRVGNISQCLEMLKEAGFWIYGLAGESGSDWNSQDFADKSVLVVGNEGKGLGTLVRRHCDAVLSIPMKNDTESLNASVSAALMLYKIQEKRGVLSP